MCGQGKPGGAAGSLAEAGVGVGGVANSTGGV
jgi:hypothetical protein